MATKDKMRDSSEYWVTTNDRTDDAFENDCFTFSFTKQEDGSYSLHHDDDPFFSDEYWNVGYLAM